METLSPTMSNVYEPHGEIRTKVWYLLPLRVYMGVMFLVAAYGKVEGGWLSDSSILGNMLTGSVDAETYPYGFYRAFFHGVLEPNIGLFSFMVVMGEICVGLALLTGTCTRWACVMAGFMMINFNIAFNSPILKQAHNTTSFLAMLLVLFLANGGMAYGADHYLRGKLPRWLV